MIRGTRPVRLLALLLLAIGLLPATAENVDPDDDDSQYAWGENVGWVNAEPAGCGDCGAEISDFAVSGYMWGENVGWISLSCQNDATCATVDFGVTNDGSGHLGGFAWSENGGWIRFSCAGDPGCTGPVGVTVDPLTGELGGYAWAENLGWISLSCTNTAACGTTDYGVKTGWCQSVATAPTAALVLTAGKSGNDVELSWTGVPDAGWYEVVQGDLIGLRSGNGDFAGSTTECPSDDLLATNVVLAGTPPPGDGFWFLVRGVNCKGKGTYDSGGPAQVGSRDAGVAASGKDCQ